MEEERAGRGKVERDEVKIYDEDARYGGCLFIRVLIHLEGGEVGDRPDAARHPS